MLFGLVVGGTFALYSLICRYAKVSLIPTQEVEDRQVSNFELELPNKNRRVRRASWLKSKLEKSPFSKFFLLFATMLGTSMVIGDGVLTPCISGSNLSQPNPPHLNLYLLLQLQSHLLSTTFNTRQIQSFCSFICRGRNQGSYILHD